MSPPSFETDDRDVSPPHPTGPGPPLAPLAGHPDYDRLRPPPAELMEPSPEDSPSVSNGKSWRLRQALGWLWPVRRPLARPEVSDDLDELDLPARVAEILRYGLAGLEYAVSPGGHLRVWLGWHLRCFLMLLAPHAVVLAVVAMLVPICEGLALILAALESAACSAVVIAGCMVLLALLMQVLPSLRKR